MLNLASTTKYVQVKPDVKDKKIGFTVQTGSKGVQSVTNVYSIGTQCVTVVQDVTSGTASNSSQQKDSKIAWTQTRYDEFPSVHEKVLYILRTVAECYLLQYEVCIYTRIYLFAYSWYINILFIYSW